MKSENEKQHAPKHTYIDCLAVFNANYKKEF